MKIKITDEERCNYLTIPDLLRAKGITSDFAIIQKSTEPNEASVIYTIKDLEPVK